MYLAKRVVPLRGVYKSNVEPLVGIQPLNGKGHFVVALQNSYVGVVLKPFLRDQVPLFDMLNGRDPKAHFRKFFGGIAGAEL